MFVVFVGWLVVTCFVIMLDLSGVFVFCFDGRFTAFTLLGFVF